MIEQGCRSLYPMEVLSVMGLFEVLRHLPAILRIRRGLIRHFLAQPPDLFIGIDAPDFNLGLEARLKRRGITTVHYVCPSVWAWRPGRVKTLRRAVDLVLSVLPFEESLLARHRVPVRFVGHPLADELRPGDPSAARRSLGLDRQGPLIALLPGSRLGEVRRLAAVFVQTARWCRQQRPELRFVVPLVSGAVRELFDQELDRVAPDLPIIRVDGRSREVMTAADLVLTASGTAALEAMLLERPMLVAYRLSRLTYRVVSGLELVKAPFISLPNLLAGQELVPEFVQQDCRWEALGPTLLDLLADPGRMHTMRRRFRELRATLQRNSSREAAAAVLELAGR
jgi:lipid-A-disaccharide synthase